MYIIYIYIPYFITINSCSKYIKNIYHFFVWIISGSIVLNVEISNIYGQIIINEKMA